MTNYVHWIILCTCSKFVLTFNVSGFPDGTGKTFLTVVESPRELLEIFVSVGNRYQKTVLGFLLS